MSDAIDVFLRDDAATAALARMLARTQPEHAVVHLQGDLGAGKSTLARAWLRALGVEGAIRSPTYTLVERYRLRDDAEALHLDLYRIAGAGELEFFGLDDARAVLWLVEWPERLAGGGLSGPLPPPDLRIKLAIDGNGRAGRLVPLTGVGERWLSAIDPGLRQFHEP